ncbi:MAG: patatin-like phospholipase family protein [Candidatus Omnitrophica bacterium]|nr:patatin-like phospholipase family protein [Candidatus Omnitrophota bacterium]
MFPFPFGKKLEAQRDYSLAEIPLFAALSSSEVKIIEKKIRLVEYKKNEVVYKQGGEPDAFYVICAGRFRVFIRSGMGIERTVTYLYRGDYFGEISILTGKPHSVTVQAINDALVLKLSRNDFNELLKIVPSLALHLSRSLGLRLRDESKEQTGEAKIVSFYNLKEKQGLTTFAVHLAASLSREVKKPVLLLDMNAESGASRALLGEGRECPVLNLPEVDVSRDAETAKFLLENSNGVTLLRLVFRDGAEFSEKKLTLLLSHLISRFNFILIDLPRDLNEMVLKVLTQSDSIYILSDGRAEGLDRCRSFVAEMKQSFNFQDSEIKLLISEALRQDHASAKEIEKSVGHKVFALLPFTHELNQSGPTLAFPPPASTKEPLGPYFRTVRYLSRELSGRLVGLALGSGAAHGFAHVGVIKVLEEYGIPVDVVTGSSMGALVAILWAAGYKSADLEQIALSLDKKNAFINILGLTDFSMAHQGFFKGNAVMRYLRGFLGQKTFRDLEFPAKVIAANLLTAEEIVFEEGDLVEAVRASISIPGIFRPFRLNGKILIDGGIVDPVPVKVLAHMGVRKIIAVNVLSGPSDIQIRRSLIKQRIQEQEQRLKDAGPLAKWFFALKNKIRDKYSSNIFNVIMNTIQYMEYSIASTATADADVVIHPVIYDAHWIEFYEAEKFIRIGEAKAREQLAEIQKLVEL